jgi:hypothetical protein
LAEDQVELAKTQYKIGRMDQSKVFTFKIKAAKTATALIKSRQSLWKQILKILKNANVDLLEYMNSAS